jgi:hypothetical protein
MVKEINTTRNNGFYILPGPFIFDANHEPEFLYAAAGDSEFEKAGKAIIKQDGIHFINRDLLSPDGKTEAELDKKFVNLVESVINTARC